MYPQLIITWKPKKLDVICWQDMFPYKYVMVLSLSVSLNCESRWVGLTCLKKRWLVCSWGAVQVSQLNIRDCLVMLTGSLSNLMIDCSAWNINKHKILLFFSTTLLLFSEPWRNCYTTLDQNSQPIIKKANFSKLTLFSIAGIEHTKHLDQFFIQE